MLKNEWTEKIRRLQDRIATQERIIAALKERNNKLRACLLSERGIPLTLGDRLAQRKEGKC
jgi:SMC interacting uncharacterized protein involved in chromosome segregation